MVFFEEFDYRWTEQHTGNKYFLSNDGVNPLKYKVPTDLALLALCAHYKIKKGFDIRFCPTISDLPEALDGLYQEVKDHDGECKKALIYSIDENLRLDSHGKKPVHVVPILFCKYQHPESGEFKIGIFLWIPLNR